MGREDLKIPDASVSLEHEWGMRYFGVTAGLAFTNLYRFTTTAEYYSNTAPETVEFPTVQTYNFVFAVRGGKPTAGFRGKISWPMPFLLDWDEPMNYVFEYSAIGMFGNEKVKGGIGIQGAYKKREVESPYQPDPSYYYDPYVNIERANEFYIMVPCGKLAFLAGKHSVVTASVDLGGLILPVQVGSGLWTPSIGLQYVYSFGELKSANAFDGSF